MKLAESVIPISEVKAHTAQFINGIVNTRCSAVITQNGRARVIVQDIASYEETQESMALLKILALSHHDIQKNRTIPLKDAFDDVRCQLQNRRTA